MLPHHQVFFVNFTHGPRFPFFGAILGALLVGLAVYLVVTLVQMLFAESDRPKPSSPIRAGQLSSPSDSLSSSDPISAVRRW